MLDRARAALDRPPLHEPTAADAFVAGLGALALGGHATADGAVSRLAREAADDDVAPLLLILLSRHLAWTGRLDFAARHRPAAARAAEAILAAGGSAGLRSAALAEAAVAAEAIGERGWADTAPAEAAADEWLGGLAGGLLDHAGWSDFASGRPEEGVARWLRLASASDEPNASVSGALAAVFVCGLLGTRPDAPRGRLRLAPALPREWGRLSVARLRMGDAAVDLEYRREHDRHDFRIDQSEGAVPLRLVFEPAVPAESLAAAEVDGRPAQLGTRPAAGRTVAAVQLALDGPRSVVLSAGGGR